MSDVALMAMHNTLPLLAGITLTLTLPAQIIATPFNNDYTFVDLGTVAGVPTDYGGIAFLPGNPNVMLLCGGANTAFGEVFTVPVTRGAGGHISSFGTPVLLSTAPNNDGGLCFDSTGVLFFTQYGNNGLGQIKPASTSPDKLISLGAFGIAGSVGTCQFVPAGYPAAGRFKIASFNGGWYDATLVPDAFGTFDIGVVTAGIVPGGGPEGILYPPAGSPGLIDYGHVLISEWISGAVSLWDIDANGDPLTGTSRVFMSGLTGAEGAVLDPVSSDFLFSTFGGGNRIIQVRRLGTCGTFTNYGSGGPGTGSLIPTIGGSGCPVIGNTIQIDIANAQPNAMGALFLGFNQLSVPFLNLTILTDLGESVGYVVSGSGTFTLSGTIPNQSIFSNIPVYWQAGFLDTGAPNGISATDGLRMFIL